MSKSELLSEKLNEAINTLNEVQTLSNKFNISHNNSQIDLGCPWIVNPLDRTEPLKKEWFLDMPSAQKDKYYRVEQALFALRSLNEIVNGDVVKGKTMFTELSSYGRVMFLNVAGKQANADDILKIIIPIANKNLDRDKIVFPDKAKINEGQIVDKHIKSIIDSYIQRINDESSNSSNNNNNNNVTIEEKEIKLVKYVITAHQKDMLQEGIKNLKSLDLYSEQCAKLLNDFQNPKGCVIEGDFLKELHDIFNTNSSDDQNNFNCDLAGLTVLLSEDDKTVDSSNNNNITAIEKKEVKLDKRVITNLEEEMLKKAFENLSGFYQIPEKAEAELNNFMNQNGCSIDTPFKQSLVDAFNSDKADDQNDFNSLVTGAVIEYFPY